MFKEQFDILLESLPVYKNMVLSTSYMEKVTSRMMSVIKMGENFYFQADCESRKAQQIKYNKNVSLCSDNIQIEGVCECVGSVKENTVFCRLFSQYCNTAYKLYSDLENEMLYEIKPVRIQRWIYENNQPFIEVIDCVKGSYKKTAYFV